MNKNKAKRLLAIFLTSALTLTFSSWTKSTEARNQSTDYFCSLKKGKLVTVADGNQGEVKLIDWQKYASNTYNINSLRSLCMTASARLKKYSDLGQLNYISLAKLNNRLFVCVSNSQGTCLKENLGYLLPLQSHQNSKGFLLGLFNAPNEAIIQGQKLVIDFQKLLQTKYKVSSSKITKYRCVNRGGTPVTVVDTPGGPIDLIVWDQNLFAQYSPQFRCNAVTNNFQKHARANNLRYISWGIAANNIKVICVSDARGKCKQDGILFTLTQQDNPETVLKSLFNINTPLSRGRKTVIDISKKF